MVVGFCFFVFRLIACNLHISTSPYSFGQFSISLRKWALLYQSVYIHCVSIGFYGNVDKLTCWYSQQRSSSIVTVETLVRVGHPCTIAPEYYILSLTGILMESDGRLSSVDMITNSIGLRSLSTCSGKKMVTDNWTYNNNPPEGFFSPTFLWLLHSIPMSLGWIEYTISAGLATVALSI